MTKQYESEVLASVHEAALGLAEAGLMSKHTMRAFDEMCLTGADVRDRVPRLWHEARRSVAEPPLGDA